MHQFGKFGKDSTALVSDLINRAGFGVQYLFLNEAGEEQRVFQSYGSENLQRLGDIRAKYEPSKVFTELLPAWRVEGWRCLSFTPSITVAVHGHGEDMEDSNILRYYS
jgi:hypothetical protein